MRLKKKHQKYKKVDLQQIEEIPEHWEISKLDVIFDIRGGYTPSRDNLDFWTNGNISWFKMDDIRKNGRVLYDSIEHVTEEAVRGGKLFPANSIIFSTSATIGEPALVTKEFIVNQSFTIFTKSKSFETKLNMKYALYYFYVIGKFCKNISNTNIFLSVDTSKLKEYKFPIPPFEEQEQISKFLDLEVGYIDKLIEKYLFKIQRLQQFKDSYIKEKVNYGIDESRSLKKFDNSVFEFIPEEWETRYLFQIAKENKIKNANMKNNNLLSLSYGKIIKKDIEKTDGLLPKSFETYQIVKSGMIILRLTDLQNDKKSLRVGLCKEEGIITSAYVALEFDEEIILPEYVYYLLYSFDISKGLYGMGKGVRQNLNYKELSTLTIPLPSLKEQKLIIEDCEKMYLDIRKFTDKANEMISLLKKLKNSLISEVVTGKIDVRNIEIPKI